MATAAIDAPYLAASFSIQESTIQTLLEAPTVELVQSLLAQLEAKAREFDTIQAEKLRSDVELENATRLGESRARALKTSLDKALKEVEDLRRKVNDEGIVCTYSFCWYESTNSCIQNLRGPKSRPS